LAYKGLRNAKSTEKLSQVLLGLGPGVICHTDSKWWNSALSATVLLTLWGGCRVTLLVYLKEARGRGRGSSREVNNVAGSVMQFDWRLRHVLQWWLHVVLAVCLLLTFSESQDMLHVTTKTWAAARIDELHSPLVQSFEGPLMPPAALEFNDPPCSPPCH
jgi:hypothetical protein